MEKVWTQRAVFELFTTGSPNRPRDWEESYIEFAELLNQGHITVEAIEYTPKPKPEKDSPEWRIFYEASFGSGGSDHDELKWFAYWWLVERGAKNIQFEARVTHGRCDVVAHDSGCLVEVGDTAPRKAVESLHEGYWKEFVLFPFLGDYGSGVENAIPIEQFRKEHPEFSGVSDATLKYICLANPLTRKGYIFRLSKTGKSVLDDFRDSSKNAINLL